MQKLQLCVHSPHLDAYEKRHVCLQMCRCDVQTYCFGLAASMGAFLLGAGTKGKRYSMPNARIMIHQPLGGASGQASGKWIPSSERYRQWQCSLLHWSCE